MYSIFYMFLIVASAMECREIPSSWELTVPQSFINNEIVPDILNVAPEYFLEINYPSGVTVLLGNKLTPTQVKDQPTASWDDAKPNKYYTLILTDPDAPSRENPTYRILVHWLVVNIPGDDVINGDTRWQFIGSAPGLDSGLHRYVFLVYEQPSYLDVDEPVLDDTSINNRTNISVLDFAEKYNLGDPVAGNFYEAQYDDYVPILLEQLGLSSS